MSPATGRSKTTSHATFEPSLGDAVNRFTATTVAGGGSTTAKLAGRKPPPGSILSGVSLSVIQFPGVEMRPNQVALSAALVGPMYTALSTSPTSPLAVPPSPATKASLTPGTGRWERLTLLGLSRGSIHCPAVLVRGVVTTSLLNAQMKVGELVAWSSGVQYTRTWSPARPNWNDDPNTKLPDPTPAVSRPK